MKLSRREFLLGSAATLVFPHDVLAFKKGSNKGWRTLALGGGGLVDGFDIASDGTAICRTDSAYVFLFTGKLPADFFNPNHKWVPIVTAQSLVPAIHGPGIGEAVIAHGQPNNLYMMAMNNLDQSSTADNGLYVYYSRTTGASWARSNLSWTGEYFVSTERKAATRKLLVDPINANVVYAGMPNGAVVANVVVSNGAGGSGTIVSICDQVGTLPNVNATAVGTLHLWSGPGGTDYGTMSSVVTATTTSSVMTWDITGTTLTIGGTNPQNFTGSVGQGLTSRGAALVPGTIITAVLGGNQYTVNNSQTASGSGNTLTASRGVLSTSRLLSMASMNITNSITANGDVTSVFRSLDGGATFSPMPISTLPQTTVIPGVCCMIYDKNSGSVTGVGGMTVTKRALIPIPGADVYETTDGGLTWNATGLATLVGSGRWMGFYTTMNHAGHVFMTATVYTVAGVGTSGIYRYSDAATSGVWVWELLTTTDVSNHGCLWVDPRSGHEGELSYASANNGPLCGYSSSNANAALGSSVTFTRTKGGDTPLAYAAPYDVPWLNYASFQKPGTYVGANYLMIDTNGYFWWCGNQIGISMGTQSDYTTPAIPNFAVTCVTYNATMSRGIENTISEYICRPPGSPYPIKCIQDQGLQYGAGYNTYGPNYYMNAQDIWALGYGVQRIDCWNASYAPGNPAFIAAKLVVNGLIPSRQAYSGYSTDSGRSWTPYAVSPENFFGSQSGEATHMEGGFICAIDEQHQICCMGVDLANQPIVTANQGGSWALCNGLPSVNWWMRYFVYGDQPPGQPFAAGQGANVGTAWAVNATTYGTAALYKSTDGGVNWSTIVSLGGANVTSFGGVYLAPVLYSVPGHDNDLWLSANFLSSTNNGVWRSTDGGLNFTKLTGLPSGGGKFVQYLCLGKAMPGSSYPTLYLLMWTSSGARLTSTLYYSTNGGDAVPTWTQIGSTPLYLDLPPNASAQGPKAIFGDWEEAGVVSISTYGSGFAYLRL